MILTLKCFDEGGGHVRRLSSFNCWSNWTPCFLVLLSKLGVIVEWECLLLQGNKYNRKVSDNRLENKSILRHPNSNSKYR